MWALLSYETSLETTLISTIVINLSFFAVMEKGRTEWSGYIYHLVKFAEFI